jgi:hypothetical protein
VHCLGLKTGSKVLKKGVSLREIRKSMWQEIIALVIIAGAAWYLFKRLLQAIRPGKTGAGGCSGCGKP